jgi:hypothetical protein
MGLLNLPKVFHRPAPSPARARPVRSFGVCPVQPGRRPLAEWPARKVVALHAGGAVEACSGYRGQLVAPRGNFLSRVYFHPLIDTLHRAWAHHHPVSLSPDVIWLTITQGLARHLQVHAEEVRARLVPHAGRHLLAVRRHDLVFGSPENPWPEVFAEFSGAIRAVIGPTHDLLAADFSTTGPVERAASEVMLLSALRPYFASKVWTLCGIPSLSLEGTVEDWERLLQRASGWEGFGLSWWLKHLLVVLEQFVAAAKGRVDLSFWQAIFQVDQRCGWEYVGGWVTSLFPYLVRHHPGGTTPVIEANSSLEAAWQHRAVALHEFGGGPGRVGFVWECPQRGLRRDMEFVGGLFGIRQEPGTLCLRPEIGWAVGEVPA